MKSDSYIQQIHSSKLRLNVCNDLVRKILRSFNENTHTQPSQEPKGACVNERLFEFRQMFFVIVHSKNGYY